VPEPTKGWWVVIKVCVRPQADVSLASPDAARGSVGMHGSARQAGHLHWMPAAFPGLPAPGFSCSHSVCGVSPNASLVQVGPHWARSSIQ
jgi:hypothetical protein